MKRTCEITLPLIGKTHGSRFLGNKHCSPALLRPQVGAIHESPIKPRRRATGDETSPLQCGGAGNLTAARRLTGGAPAGRWPHTTAWLLLAGCVFLAAAPLLAQTVTAAVPTGNSAFKRAEHDWFWKGRLTPGANLFLLRQRAIQQVKAMRAQYLATSLGPLVTQPWQPAFSATTELDAERAAGATLGIAVDPTNTSIVYAASDGGGVWKTTDAGTSWTPLTDQQTFTHDGSFAMDPNNPSVLYVGAGGGYAAGILKSSDGGTTWSLITGPFVGLSGASSYFGGNKGITAIAIQPGNPNVILAGSAPDFVMYRSADGGSTWSTVIKQQAFIEDILFDPTNANTVYASVCYGYSPQNPGVYKSADGGATWNQLSGGLPTSTQIGNVPCRLAMSPSNPSVLAVLFNGANGNPPTLFTTSNGGNTWSQVSSPPEGAGGAGLFFSPTSSSILFLGATRLHRSLDGGQTWQDITQGANGVAMHVDQDAHAWVGNTNQLYMGNDGGVFYTPDATASAVNWTDMNNGLATLRLYQGMALHPTDPNIVLAGTQDEGAILSNDSLDWNTVFGGDEAFSAIDQQDPLNMYTTVYCCWLVQKSSNGGVSFSQAINGINTSDPMNFFAPLAIDPSVGSTLYFGTDRVYQTIDGAQTWTAISPSFNNLNSLAVSPKNSNTVYAAESHKVWTSTNALSGPSATWSGSTSGLPTGRTFESIVADPRSAQTAYLAVSDFSGFGDNLGHIFKTTDGGSTWVDISGNLPNIPADDIAVDPDLANTLYLGTDAGMFLTTDGGATWVPLGSGLPNVIVTSVRLFEPSRILLVSTYGRGVWELDVPVPTVTVSPSSLDFGSQPVGTASAAQTVTLTNGGTTTLTIASITVAGTNSGDFSQANTCASSVAASTSCTISVTFAPQATGNRAADLTITDDAFGSPQTVALTGTGTGSAASVSPTSLTFSGQTVGATSTAQTVTLSNTGNASLSISSVTVSAEFAETNNCGSSVVAGSNCTISVTFTPTAAGSRTGTLSITDNAASSPQTVALSGTGEDFGVAVASGTSATSSVTAGSSASYSLSVTPLGGFNQAVSLTCTGAPSLATCSTSPAAVTLDGTNASTVKVTVTTTARGLTPPGLTEPQLPPPMGRLALWLSVLGLLALAVLLAERDERFKPLVVRARLAPGAAMLLAVLATGCGGGGSSAPPPAPGTPAGTYTLTVTGTSAGLTRSTTVTLTVQ